MNDKTLQSPFKEAAPSLISNGYTVIPEIYASHKPACKVKPYHLTQPSREKYIEWYKKSGQHNIGVMMGESSKVIGVDFDYDVDELHSKIKKFLGPIAVAKKGSKGFTAFYRYNGEKSKAWSKSGQVVIEILSTKAKTTIPPSIHPSTNQPYTWITDLQLADLKPEELSYLPEDFIPKLDKLFGQFVEKRRPTSTVNRKDAQPVDRKVVEEALEYIASDEYTTWINVGMALKHALPEEGYELWEAWSQTSVYFESEQLPEKWESFDSEEITIGSIFHLAKQKGFKVPPSHVDTVPKLVDFTALLATLNDWRKDGRPMGVKSGIASLDDLLHIRSNEFTVITGTPNSGKSEFVDFLIFNLIKNHKMRAMYASFEKHPASHVESFIHRFSGKQFNDRSAEDDLKYTKEIQKSLIFYNHTESSRQIDHILEEASRQDINLLVLDPFNYLESPYTGQTFEHVKYLCKSIHQFCLAQDVHVFLVAHPRTQREKGKDGSIPRLNLYDISGGSDFYNIADNGIVIYRDGNILGVDIQKVRHQDIDRTGAFKLEYNKPTRLYDELQFEGEF